MSIDYIVKYGLEFEPLILKNEDIRGATEFYYDSYSGYNKEKDLSGGKLYYSSAFIGTAKGDYKITYYQFKTTNKLTVIGAKKGNEIVPKKDLEGYENYEVFKAAGDDYKINDFIQILKDEGHAVYVIFNVFTIIAIIVAIGFCIFGFFKWFNILY